MKRICVIFLFEFMCKMLSQNWPKYNVNLNVCHRNNLLIGEQFILFDRNNHQQIDSILACANWIILFVCEWDSGAAEYTFEIWVECRRRRRVCVLFVIQINYWCCNESYYMLKLIYNSVCCCSELYEPHVVAALFIHVPVDENRFLNIYSWDLQNWRKFIPKHASV